MQLFQSHSYTLIHSIFLEKLYVSFYQSANKNYQWNYFHDLKNTLFSEISEKV